MKFLIALCFAFLMSFPARAEFIITSAILEFTKDTPHQQDIEIVSRSNDTDYLVTELAEIVKPGLGNETRRVIDDPSTSDLLVTPDKVILTGGSRKVMRFVLLKDNDANEHIYRLAIKPMVKGIDNNTKVGLKVLIGYEALVIIRPTEIKPDYQAKRQGNTLYIYNKGNSNVLFQNGQQCISADKCKMPPVLRVYAGQTTTITLPFDAPVNYSIWDGQQTIEKKFD